MDRLLVVLKSTYKSRQLDSIIEKTSINLIRDMFYDKIQKHKKTHWGLRYFNLVLICCFSSKRFNICLLASDQIESAFILT
jgi:hypothetical protein